MNLCRPIVVVALLVAAASLLSAGNTSSANSSLAVNSTMAAASFCDFERPCVWDSKDGGFKIVTGQEVNNSWVPSDGHLAGPFTDADNNTNGHFLYLLMKNKDTSREYHVRSPKFAIANPSCRLTFWYHMYVETDYRSRSKDTRYQGEDRTSHSSDWKSQSGNIKVVIESSGPNRTQFVIKEVLADDRNKWANVSLMIGRQTDFTILLVVAPSRQLPSHVAFDNITLTNCFQGLEDQPECTPLQYKCRNSSVCIDYKSVCDLVNDCAEGDDENQSCDEVPPWARCTFEGGMCFWQNKEGRDLHWKMKNGSLPTTSMGPNFDHTWKNATGMYIYVDMTGGHKMGTSSELVSPVFNPPPTYHSNISSPYYNSCYISFFYHKFGPHSGSLGLFLIEMKRDMNDTAKLWWSYGNKDTFWQKHVVTLPNNITSRYYFIFEARKSYASRGDPALDDISMSPRCFGKGVNKTHLNGYVYDAYEELDPTVPLVTHRDFENATVYLFTTCGKTGPTGPTQEQCDAAYNNTDVEVEVQTDKRMAGIQKWVVPENGYYTIIAKGASGGMGGDGQGISKGSVVRTVMELQKGLNLYILVGQEGMRSCRKNFMKNTEAQCEYPDRGRRPQIENIKRLNFLPEGGGGGGGSFVFLVNKNGKEKKPLVVAGGGGGLAHGMFSRNTTHHGQGLIVDQSPITGTATGSYSAGGGGGWAANNASFVQTYGLALMQGGVGGRPCYNTLNGSEWGSGGFGGGGGGCTAGGGGGGYAGGRAWAGKGLKGEGGYSWIEGGLLHRLLLATSGGPGEVLIIPAIQGCDCDYLCVALDQVRAATQCLCPENWHLSNDSVHCIMNPVPSDVSFSTTMLGAVLLIFIFMATVFAVYLYSRYLKRKKSAMVRRKMLSGTDLQLNRLRVASDSMMTEYNPNYEFGGGIYSLKDLKEIPRENLRLVKALGQGAFGEVYQGLYRHRAGDAVEMPVAVKTLPHLSTSQAETDFLMEALIMSKFKHPNIVHFIGVCFDQHPRFIVIELLAGGDLKTFLRESRPKPDRAASLTMKDLLSCIVDVAKGCKYMEENRFIHRDIAARNCLLTSKGPGRVVKIADFGMARDIYRADYYRKGGKAMLPIKWMPPEAFLDGIFTTKTDVWSFGVLMWEVLSMGYMPYTGCANREVMQLVTNGGRLAPPTNCPPQLYAIMTQCWQPNPEERPTFGLILERLGYCMQDPDVKRAPLPVYTKPPSSERDTTIMRPSAVEDCIQPDYLIPLPGPQEWADYPDQLSDRTRSTQRLIDGDSVPSPTVNGPNLTNNNNPVPAPTLTKPHLNNLNIDPSVYTVSSTLKQDAEISC